MSIYLPDPDDPLRLAGCCCPHCKYELKGLRYCVCPECGVFFDLKEVRHCRLHTCDRPDFFSENVVPALVGAILGLIWIGVEHYPGSGGIGLILWVLAMLASLAPLVYVFLHD